MPPALRATIDHASDSGLITQGSPDVFVEGLPAVRVGDPVMPHDYHTGTYQVAQGSSTVFVNGLPMARLGDISNCGDVLNPGEVNVFVDDQQINTEFSNEDGDAVSFTNDNGEQVNFRIGS